MSPAEERLSSMQGSTKRRASARRRRLSEKLSDQMDHDTSECIYPEAEHKESLVEDRLTRDEAGGTSSSQHQASVRAVFKRSRRSSRRRRLAKIALMVSLLQSTCFVAGKAFPSLFLEKVWFFAGFFLQFFVTEKYCQNMIKTLGEIHSLHNKCQIKRRSVIVSRTLPKEVSLSLLLWITLVVGNSRERTFFLM